MTSFDASPSAELEASAADIVLAGGVALGQVEGGVLMGVGQAISEGTIYGGAGRGDCR